MTGRKLTLWGLRPAILGAMCLALSGAGREDASGSSGVRQVEDPPPAVVRAVTQEVARRWGVEEGRVRLDWRPGRDPFPESHTSVGLLGAGAGGEWVVEVDGPEGVVRRGVRAGVESARWVAVRDMPRGHVLSAADMRRDLTVVWGPPGPGEVVPLAGWVTRRQVRAGEALRAPAVAPPVVVSVGSIVEVHLRRGPVMLRMDGEVRGAGAVQDTVRVRLPTGKIVVGTVFEGPRVEVIQGPDGEVWDDG